MTAAPSSAPTCTTPTCSPARTRRRSRSPTPAARARRARRSPSRWRTRPATLRRSVEALADPKSGNAPLRVRFSSAATDPDGDQLQSVWDFGDGVKAGGTAATHTYTQPRIYNAKVDGHRSGRLVGVGDRPGRGHGGERGRQRDRAAAADGDVEGETRSRPLVRLTRTHKVARVVKRGLRYTVSCESQCRVSSVLRIAGGDKQRLGASRVRLIAAGALAPDRAQAGPPGPAQPGSRDAQGARAQPEGDRRPDGQDGGRHDHVAQAGRARALRATDRPAAAPDPGGGRRALSCRLMRGFADGPNE